MITRKFKWRCKDCGGQWETEDGMLNHFDKTNHFVYRVKTQLKTKLQPSNPWRNAGRYMEGA